MVWASKLGLRKMIIPHYNRLDECGRLNSRNSHFAIKSVVLNIKI